MQPAFLDMNSDLAVCMCSQDQCRGCRRVQNGDRKHTFEILFAHGPPLQLSASTKVDENSWLMAICNAVTNPVGVSISSSFSVVVV